MERVTTKPRDDFDHAWKEILEQYFRKFLEFFFPQAANDIDWGRGLEFLDKELQYAIRRAGRGRRTVDMLARVWRKDGEEAWVLLHVEVQAQVEADFARRMFLCNSLLHGRHKRCIVSFAVLGDTQEKWHPNTYAYGLWNCNVQFAFPAAKLLDYEKDWEQLERSANPFAAVVMAHLKTQATRRKMTSRLEWKLRILRWLHEQGRSQEEFIDLLRFIDLTMALPEDLERKCEREMERYEEEHKMPLISNFERRAMERGLQRGSLQATQEAVLEALHLRFKKRPPLLTRRIRELEDTSTLKKLHRKAITAASLEEFERALPPASASH